MYLMEKENLVIVRETVADFLLMDPRDPVYQDSKSNQTYTVEGRFRVFLRPASGPPSKTALTCLCWARETRRNLGAGRRGNPGSPGAGGLYKPAPLFKSPVGRRRTGVT